jgi:hypothetical protein
VYSVNRIQYRRTEENAITLPGVLLRFASTAQSCLALQILFWNSRATATATDRADICLGEEQSAESLRVAFIIIMVSHLPKNNRQSILSTAPAAAHPQKKYQKTMA